ncbi:hypothetical protein BKA62DRAFT_456969 [Auriculariales sp. MPI-PUGE-AT-0066]|nr:hypothetical protein BKA62DRAFT_456969 [Auriculariales sp. MPI-PUGE-AT-0066]
MPLSRLWGNVVRSLRFVAHRSYIGGVFPSEVFVSRPQPFDFCPPNTPPLVLQHFSMTHQQQDTNRAVTRQAILWEKPAPLDSHSRWDELELEFGYSEELDGSTTQLDHLALLFSVRVVSLILAAIPLFVDLVSSTSEVPMAGFYAVAASFLVAFAGLWRLLSEWRWMHSFGLLAVAHGVLALELRRRGTWSAVSTLSLIFSNHESPKSVEPADLDVSLLLTIYAGTLAVFWLYSLAVVSVVRYSRQAERESSDCDV